MRILPALAIAAAIAVPHAASAQTVDTAAVRRTLARNDSAFSAAYVRGDFAGIAAMYTPDAQLLPSRGPVTGRDSIQRYFTYGPNTKLLSHRLEMTSLVVHGDMAAEAGKYTIVQQRGAAPATTTLGHYMLVWLRQRDGKWLIQYDMWHTVPAAPATPPAAVTPASPAAPTTAPRP